jgi:hypothetical protein
VAKRTGKGCREGREGVAGGWQRVSGGRRVAALALVPLTHAEQAAAQQIWQHSTANDAHTQALAAIMLACRTAMRSRQRCVCRKLFVQESQAHMQSETSNTSKQAGGRLLTMRRPATLSAAAAALSAASGFIAGKSSTCRQRGPRYGEWHLASGAEGHCDNRFRSL